MTERLRTASTTGYQSPKMENDLSPRKTMLVLVIVVGCFAVLWPKVFYPMLMGSANHHIKPSPIDKTTGCCDVISEVDINTIKILSELCGTIIKGKEDNSLSGKEVVHRCRQEVLDTCGIDISPLLQEQVRLGQNVKQILDEIRSLNGSLCLKYNYGLAPWRIGVPHRVANKSASEFLNIRQERPMHLRSELVHPAFRERGRAIPQPQAASPSRPPPRIVEGRPGPIPGMRPTLGGAGHVVPPSKQGTSSMSVIMPIYTIGIVIFFTYTLMKIIFKKQPDGVGSTLYPPIDPDPHFRKEVFESESSRIGPRLTRDNISSKLGWLERDAIVNAMSALLDEVDQEIEARRKSSEVASQDLVNGSLSNGDAVKPQDEEQPTVKVLGMEMTASCEGGKKWSRPSSPMVPISPSPTPVEPAPPPQEIYLEGALPPQSHLLVSESATEPQPATGEDPAVVLSGKVTLSVVNIDSENGEETINNAEDNQELVEQKIEKPLEKEISFKIEDEADKLLSKLDDDNTQSNVLEKDIQEFLNKLKEQNDLPTPTITLESNDTEQPLEVDLIEKEVDDLIQEALESVKQKEVSDLTEEQKTNENDLICTNVEIESIKLESTNTDITEAPKSEENTQLPTRISVANEETNELVVKAENGVTVSKNAEVNVSGEEGSDSEELIEEIEEIVYEDESGDEEEVEVEEIEVEEEEEEEEDESEEIQNAGTTNRTESSSVQRINGTRSEDLLEESKYTTVSGATAAENDISDEELTDNEEVEEDEEEEIIEVEEDECRDVNHVSGDSEPE